MPILEKPSLPARAMLTLLSNFKMKAPLVHSMEMQSVQGLISMVCVLAEGLDP